MEAGNKVDRLKSIFIPVGVTLGVILIIGILIYTLAIPFDLYILNKLYNHIVARIVNMTGINQWLVKGVVIIALIPLVWVIPHVYRGKFKKTARGVGLLYFGVFFLSLFFLSKDLNFTHSGKEILKYYALTPEGVTFFDSAGVDPVYGITLKPVTPDVIGNLKRLQKGDFKPIDAINAQFFNPITGEPQIWFYQYPDGGYEFYDKPGYHPITGEPLKPTTKQVYFEWKEKTKIKPLSVEKEKPVGDKGRQISAKKEKPVGDRTRQAQQLAMGLRPQIDEKEKRLQEFKSLINYSVNVQSGKSNVALVVEAKNTEGGVSPESLLSNRLKAENANIIDNLFKKSPFKARGYFEEIYDGNTELLRQTDVLSKLDNLILGKLNYSCQRGVAVNKELVSCDIRFSYKVFDKNGDAVRSDSINAVGPGVSEDAALDRGLEILIGKYSDRILKK